MTTAPGFLTNHELDLFLGGGSAGQRQRLRLSRAGLLPQPADLGRVRQFNITVFPRFVLAGLVRDLASIPEATDTMHAVTVRALSSSAFGEVCRAVQESARLLDGWNFDALIRGAVERAGDAMSEWEEVVERAQRELADQLSISFSTEIGVIEQVAGDLCVVALDSGRVEQVPLLRVVASAEEGRPVALERVSVLAKELGYVMPLKSASDAQERELAGWFARMTVPAAVTAAVEPDTSHYEPLPYRRSAPRRTRWHGASTMTRGPSAG